MLGSVTAAIGCADMRVFAWSVLFAAVVALPAQAAQQTGFSFGRVGGNIRPFAITIATTGLVTATGAAPAHRRIVSKAQLAELNRLVVATEFSRLPAVTACPATLPDVAAQFIRVGRRTVRVHGRCVARFNRLWTALSKSSG
jgi:hypothetical protein